MMSSRGTQPGMCHQRLSRPNHLRKKGSEPPGRGRPRVRVRVRVRVGVRVGVRIRVRVGGG